MDIRILPGNIANMIAAGEVVQRPSSVVKELMENAVDAGATDIHVVISDSGRTLIQVIDNGCGMSPDDAVLCFERHATSKIASAGDLENILTFGFRGEALASIAAVAEVTLKTRRAEDEVGVEVEFADSRHVSTNQVSTPTGSNFAVRNLFYNVPARRKFLKSDNVELKHIVEEFIKVALTRCDISFSLSNNSRDIFVLKSAKSLKFRIQDLLGSGVVNEVVEISAETSVAALSGYVGRPDLAKKTSGNQYFFVNGRYFRSPYFHKAVMKAYENMIPDGAVPSYFIYLEVDPHSVDVNIHPSKNEVKFEDDSVIFQVIYASVKEALGKNSFGAAIDFDNAAALDIPVIGRHFDDFKPETSAPEVSVDPFYNPFEPEVTRHYVSGSQDYGRLFEDNLVRKPSIMIVKGKYILRSAESGVLVINVRRANERILYERFLASLSNREHVSQTSLFPVQVVVGAPNILVFAEHEEMLSGLGFDITPFGNDTVVVNGLPEGFPGDQEAVETMLAELIMIIGDDSSSLPALMDSAIAEKLAKMGAAQIRPVTETAEAQRLIEQLFACENSEFTSSGLKIVNLLSEEDLDKKF